MLHPILAQTGFLGVYLQICASAALPAVVALVWRFARRRPGRFQVFLAGVSIFVGLILAPSILDLAEFTWPTIGIVAATLSPQFSVRLLPPFAAHPPNPDERNASMRSSKLSPTDT